MGNSLGDTNSIMELLTHQTNSETREKLRAHSILHEGWIQELERGITPSNQETVGKLILKFRMLYEAYSIQVIEHSSGLRFLNHNNVWCELVSHEVLCCRPNGLGDSSGINGPRKWLPLGISLQDLQRNAVRFMRQDQIPMINLCDLMDRLNLEKNWLA